MQDTVLVGNRQGVWEVILQPADFRKVGFGSNCDIAECHRHVGCAPVSGHADGSVEGRKRARSRRPVFL
jgi:hypothetical protein